MSDSLQCQHKNRTHSPAQKPPPIGKGFFFQVYGKTAHATQCSKLRALPKGVDLTPDIVLFVQLCVIIKVILISDQLNIIWLPL